MNLLQETIDDIKDYGKSIDGIENIGSEQYSCTWEEFKVLADINYDSGFGGQNVSCDLVILFKDKSWMERGEYDGSEWWEFKSPPVFNKEDKKIESLFSGSWNKIGE